MKALKDNTIIRALRKRASISRDTLSKRTGISYKTLQRYEESDNPKMSLGNLLVVLDALGFYLEIKPFIPKEANTNEAKASKRKNKRSAKMRTSTKSK